MSYRWPDITSADLRSLIWELEAEYDRIPAEADDDPFRVAARAALAILADGLRHRTDRPGSVNPTRRPIGPL